MRVVYADPDELRTLDHSVQEFWHRLGDEIAASDLERASRLCEELDDRLSFEAYSGEGGALGYAIRATSREAYPIADRVTAAAPSALTGLVSSGRPRLPFERAIGEVKRRTGVDLTRARARAGFARGHLVDVAVFVPGGRGKPEETEAANQVVDFLLGEEQRRDFVGEIRTAPAPKGGALKVLDQRTDSRTFPLEELPEAVFAAVRGLYSGLPEVPWWATKSEPEYVMFELETEPAEDYTAQDDVAFASTCLPEMLHCFLRGASFSSARFSRHGETFAYLKYHAGGAAPARVVEARDELEQVLDRALVDAECGRVIGRGIGLVYAYLELALHDVTRSAEVVREIGARRDLGPRSWLLFCDSHLADEWIGVRPDAPEPP
jgi:hypothetical protein